MRSRTDRVPTRRWLSANLATASLISRQPPICSLLPQWSAPPRPLQLSAAIVPDPERDRTPRAVCRRAPNQSGERRDRLREIAGEAGPQLCASSHRDAGINGEFKLALRLASGGARNLRAKYRDSCVPRRKKFRRQAQATSRLVHLVVLRVLAHGPDRAPSSVRHGSTHRRSARDILGSAAAQPLSGVR